MRTCRIAVLARAPVPGQCKTRLMRRYGARGAARLHQRLVLHSLRLATATGWPVELWCAPDSRHGFFHRCRRYFGLRLRRQVRGDLGRRMAAALAGGRGEAPGAIVIGTDCLTLTLADLRAAAAELAHADAVLQPAEDGGYVLLGARRPLHAALRDIDWSSGRECAQTRRRLARRGLSCALRPPRWDVDHPQDLRRARRMGLLREAR